MNVPGIDTMNFTHLAFAFIVLLVGFIGWYFVNRASVRASEQIALLQALLEQQKRQNVLLRKLCDANAPVVKLPVAQCTESDDSEDFVKLVAER